MREATIDITREVCPMTYVRVKLALEALEDGGTLEVVLRGEEPLQNVPRSVREDGHQVLSLEALADGRTRLMIRAHHQDLDLPLPAGERAAARGPKGP